MKAVFLCAGYGTRLYPLTENKPKALLPVAGETLLTHLLRKIERIRSIKHIVVVTNDRFYRDFCAWKDKVVTARTVSVINDGTKDPESRLGAIQDLKLAWEDDGLQGDVLALAGDNLFDSELVPFVSFAESKKPASSVGVFDIGDLGLAKKYGLIQANSSGKITAFFEKPDPPPTTLASMGIYYFPKGTLADINRYLSANRNPDAPGYFIAWLSKEKEVFAFPFKGGWFDIGDFHSYEKADQFFQTRREKQGKH